MSHDVRQFVAGLAGSNKAVVNQFIRRNKMKDYFKPPNELLEGIRKFLSENRDSLTIKEVSLLIEVEKHFEFVVEHEHSLSRSEIIKVSVQIITRLFEFFSDSSLYRDLMELF